MRIQRHDAAVGEANLRLPCGSAAQHIPGLDLRTRDYVMAAKTRGESPWYIMFVEILPNARGPRIPAGRMGEGGDIAAAVVYLASKEAGYVTGQTLHVNGGMAMLS